MKGILIADVALVKEAPAEEEKDEFWIREIPPILQELWYPQGAVGRDYYLSVTRPFRNDDLTG